MIYFLCYICYCHEWANGNLGFGAGSSHVLSSSFLTAGAGKVKIHASMRRAQPEIDSRAFWLRSAYVALGGAVCRSHWDPLAAGASDMGSKSSDPILGPPKQDPPHLWNLPDRTRFPPFGDFVQRWVGLSAALMQHVLMLIVLSVMDVATTEDPLLLAAGLSTSWTFDFCGKTGSELQLDGFPDRWMSTCKQPHRGGCQQARDNA